VQKSQLRREEGAIESVRKRDSTMRKINRISVSVREISSKLGGSERNRILTPSVEKNAKMQRKGKLRKKCLTTN
jgi:hypothetical protein